MHIFSRLYFAFPKGITAATSKLGVAVCVRNSAREKGGVAHQTPKRKKLPAAAEQKSRKRERATFSERSTTANNDLCESSPQEAPNPMRALAGAEMKSASRRKRE